MTMILKFFKRYLNFLGDVNDSKTGIFTLINSFKVFFSFKGNMIILFVANGGTFSSVLRNSKMIFCKMVFPFCVLFFCETRYLLIITFESPYLEDIYDVL